MMPLAHAVCLALGAVGSATDGSLADHVVILVNEAVPESVRLGQYYAQRRGVPADRICRLRTTSGEAIGREAFQSEVLEPVQRFLVERRLLVRRGEMTVNQAHYLVPVYGVPVRVEPVIAKDGKPLHPNASDRASVDSELALTLQGSWPTAGMLPNPYFNQVSPFGKCLLKTNKGVVAASSVMCLVTRLDGPSEAVVRRMIDDALAVEARGLAGRAYIDARGLREGPYRLGDKWLLEAADLLGQAGFPCQIETTEALLPAEAPLPEAAVYLGWYTTDAYGRFLDPGFRFVPGAIAYHLHSFSASILRSQRQRWVGPLVARGAAVTAGHVYEPYLQFTPQLNIFMDRLLRGRPFAEAGYASIPALSWQNVFLGDPLYRPLAVRRSPASRPAGRADAEALRREVLGGGPAGR